MVTARVGGDLDSWCTSCKIMILHTVVAMVGSDVRKVQCNSCASQHVFRAHPPGEGPTRKASASRPAAAAKKAKLKPTDYSRLMEGRARTDARRYSPKSVFRPGEVIQHPTFGLGVATSLKDQTKVEVLFEDGPRVLVHAR